MDAVAGGGQAARNVSTQLRDRLGIFDVLGVRMQIGRPFNGRGRHAALAVPRRRDQRSPVAVDVPAAPGRAPADTRRGRRALRDPRRGGARRFTAPNGCRRRTCGCRARATPIVTPHAGGPLRRPRPRRYYELVARLAPGATWPRAQRPSSSRFARGCATNTRRRMRNSARWASTSWDRSDRHPSGREILRRVIGFAAGGGERPRDADRVRQRRRAADDSRHRPQKRESACAKALGAGRWRLHAPAPGRRDAALDAGRSGRRGPRPVPAKHGRHRVVRRHRRPRHDAADRLAGPRLHGRGLAGRRPAVLDRSRDPRDQSRSGGDAAVGDAGRHPTHVRRHIAGRLPAVGVAHAAGRGVPARGDAHEPRARAARVRSGRRVRLLRASPHRLATRSRRRASI